VRTTREGVKVKLARREPYFAVMEELVNTAERKSTKRKSACNDAESWEGFSPHGGQE